MTMTAVEMVQMWSDDCPHKQETLAQFTRIERKGRERATAVQPIIEEWLRLQEQLKTAARGTEERDALLLAAKDAQRRAEELGYDVWGYYKG